MRQPESKKGIHAKLLVGALLWLVAGQLWAQTGNPPPFTDYPSYVAWMHKNHKAPFTASGAMATQSGAKALQAKAVQAAVAGATGARHVYQNVQVNQDRNPWAKAGTASAIDPSAPNNWVVMSNDFRANQNRVFYHVSSTHGKTWTDDLMVGGADPNIGSLPLSYQSNPAISFDDAGNSSLSALGLNVIVDFTNNYLNLDSEVDQVQGFSHGAYSDVFPTVIDSQACNGMLVGPFVCNGALNQPQNSTDANSGSPTAGTNYVYYAYFCNLPSGNCTDGAASIPSYGSAILESHSAGPGEAYSTPALVSGAQINAGFPYMVIDPSGTAHIFFDDYTSNSSTINMWESTLSGGVWTVSTNPVATFVYSDLNNPNWAFTDGGAAAPGCAIHGFTAYCAFSAEQVAGGSLESTPSVYLATINVTTGVSRVARVNNDKFNNQKDHFFAWATATPAGAVYVGWYDDRNDPANTNVQYFVGKSLDGGRTFPIQQAVNDVPFNPCNGFPGCGYFGDYTQLASEPDGVVHAAWSDTRDGLSMQIWSQTVPF